MPLRCYNALETCLGTRISALQLRGGRQCSGSVARRVHDGLLTQMSWSRSQIARSACEARANAFALVHCTQICLGTRNLALQLRDGKQCRAQTPLCCP